MAKFKITRKLNLGFLGEGWEQCSLTFNALSTDDIVNKLAMFASFNEKDFKAISEAMSQMLNLISSIFIEGTALNEKGEVVPVTADDLKSFPPSVLRKVIDFLAGDLQESKS
jgi:hypothetical protein